MRFTQDLGVTVKQSSLWSVYLCDASGAGFTALSNMMTPLLTVKGRRDEAKREMMMPEVRLLAFDTIYQGASTD